MLSKQLWGRCPQLVLSHMLFFQNVENMKIGGEWQREETFVMTDKSLTAP